MPIINGQGGQAKFVINKLYSVDNRLIALYYNGAIEDITGLEGLYEEEGIVLPEPIVIASPYDFANASDTQISGVIASAKAGAIDLHDYWTVGDTRTISLPAMEATGVGESHAAQDVEFVIMHDFQKDGSLGGIQRLGGGIGFLIGQKDCLNEGGYMNSTNTNSGSWAGSARRTWCNDVYYNALPSYFKDNIVDMSIKTAKTYNGSTNESSYDKCALFAAKEIFGGTASSAGASTSYSNLTEFNALTQVKYYETAANRIKKMNGSAAGWWERSPYYDNATRFCCVDAGGSAGNYPASYTYGLAPFFCI